jgi:hypothetical protein
MVTIHGPTSARSTEDGWMRYLKNSKITGFTNEEIDHFNKSWQWLDP